MPQKRGSTRSRRWLEWSSTPAAASHLAAIRLLPDNSPSYRCSPPAVPRRRVQRAPFWADAGVAACAALLPREARIDSSTSAGSVDPHPTLAPSLRSRRVAPTSPLRSTTPPAGVIAPHACCETPQIAAANAPHPRVLIVSCRQASRPRHTVSAKLKCSHACLPETHLQTRSITAALFCASSGLWHIAIFERLLSPIQEGLLRRLRSATMP